MVSKKKIKAALLAAFLMLTLTACSKKHYTEEDRIRIESSDEYKRKEFDVGKHIISIPLEEREDPRDKVMQYEYHEGYKVIGIAVTDYRGSYTGSCIMYKNDYPVICKGESLDNYGNIIYGFGEAVGYEQQEEYKTKFLKLFYPGEHILSIPIDTEMYTELTQYQEYEGYEAVGIGGTRYCDNKDSYNTCVLYVNTKPVLCSLTEERDNKEYYLTFGEPVEKEKIKELIISINK